MHTKETHLAQGLGWFSIGLGVAELLMPRQVGKAAGLSNHSSALRLAGARELASGIGILTQRDPTAWIWSRVAGDLMDLGLLVSELRSDRANRARVQGALAAVLGVTALDVYCGLALSRHQRDRAHHHPDFGDGRGRTFETGKPPFRTSITIGLPASEIYAFWRDFANLPQFMAHLKSVEVIDATRSRWTAKGPAGTEVSWDAEIIEEKENELIAWRSLPGSTVENAGSVRFEPATGGRGTIVRVSLQYRPPAGALGTTVAKLFGEAPEKQIPVDLMRIKQLLETGEIPTTQGQPSGRSTSTSPVYDEWLRR